MAPVSRSLCLILRRTNEFFRKGVDSFSTLPIMRLHTAGVISSAGRAPPLQGGGRRFDPVITHHFGSLAQLVEQLTFNQLVAGSNPARPTNVKRRPKGAFLLCVEHSPGHELPRGDKPRSTLIQRIFNPGGGEIAPFFSHDFP